MHDKTILYGEECSEEELDIEALKHLHEMKRQVMIIKHSAYGSRGIKRHGIRGLLIRIGDKFERAMNLVERSNIDCDDETLLDTLIDTSNYIDIAILILKNKWIKKQKDKNNG